MAITRRAQHQRLLRSMRAKYGDPMRHAKQIRLTPDAYAVYVGGLLPSERFGERPGLWFKGAKVVRHPNGLTA